MVVTTVLVLKILPLFFVCFTAHSHFMAGSISASMGGTGRAGVQGNESLFLNPAALAFLDHFYMGVGYQSGFLLRDVHRESYGGILIDSTPELIASGALAYRRHRIRQGKKQRFMEDEFKLGLAYALSAKLSLGLAATHLKAKNETNMNREIEQTNGDVGLLLALTPHWNLSLVGENILDRDSKVPVALIRESLISLGTQYIYKLFLTLRYEILHPMEKNSSLFSHRMGLGMKLQSYFHLNVGLALDEHSGQTRVTAGFSWLGPRLKLAYAFQSERKQRLGDRHLVDLWFDI